VSDLRRIVAGVNIWDLVEALGGRAARRMLRWLWPPVALLVVALVASQFGPDLLAWKAHRVEREYRQIVDGILGDSQPTPQPPTVPVAPGKLRQLRHELRNS
jgi:hypothetical protein